MTLSPVGGCEVDSNVFQSLELNPFCFCFSVWMCGEVAVTGAVTESLHLKLVERVVLFFFTLFSPELWMFLQSHYYISRMRTE